MALLGLIDQPYIGERFMGGRPRRGRGPAEPARGAALRRAAGAVLYTTFPEIGTVEERAGFEAVRDRCG